MDQRIFVVDDDPKITKLYTKVLKRDGYEVEAFMNPTKMVEAIEDGDTPDLMLADMKMPQMTGVEVLETLNDIGLDIPVIIMTGHSTVQTAVEAMRQGAFHYLQKPVNLEEMRALIEKAFKLYGAKQELDEIKDQKKAEHPIEGILGESDAIVRVRETIQTLCDASNTTVLFSGETGTGKNLAAETLHYNSTRAKESFMEINCAALPENLLEAELFGYEKGAFTDARDAKPGLFEIANGGTVFLDEIDSMSMGLQAKLLSFLESRTFRRLGGVEDRTVDTRVLCATNADLEGQVKEKEFRKDLFFRINVVNVRMPALRHMGDDVILIAGHMIDNFNRELNREVQGFTEPAKHKLRQHMWPGNVRELRNVLERAMIFTNDDRIDAEDLVLAPPGRLDDDQSLDGAFTFPLGRSLKEVEKEYIKRMLEVNSDSSYVDIADTLDISKKTLWDKRKRYNLDEEVDR